MFLRQRSIPVANQQDLLTDTEQRILSIIALATAQLQARHFHHRHVIFPLFIAGYATTQPDVKIQALDIIKAFEGHGIGQNTFTTRKLLSAVYEEQRKVAESGGRMEDVDWIKVARDRSLTVVNCGL
jgi:GNAT superfamily N-acetyltransferase